MVWARVAASHINGGKMDFMKDQKSIKEYWNKY